MTGAYRVQVYNKKVKYDFIVKRNITIIRGDSGTGKTNLIQCIKRYEADRNKSDVTLICNKSCSVLESSDWQLRLSNNKDTIFYMVIKRTDIKL